jgi:hypothetical protein
MMTVGDDITTIQTRLHDDGTIWTQAELLRFYNDGYREILAKSQAFSRLLPLDVPGRHSYAVTYPWETRHTSGGTWWLPMLACYGGTRQVTSQWEVEHLDGVSPTASLTGLTMQWERAYSTETDRHFQFGLPADHERVKRLEWHNRALQPVAVREFDEVDDAWMRRVGSPHWWTTGVGAVRSVEVYEITTEYTQAYQLIDANTGLPREMSGDRTYAIEVDSYNPSNAYAYSSQGDKDALVQSAAALLSGMGYRFTGELEDKTIGFYVTDWEADMLNGDTVDTETTPAYHSMFTWESAVGGEVITFGLGGARFILSPDRQYVPMVSEAAPFELLGTIRDWRSSEDNLMALEVVVPPVDLGLTDAPVMIPEPFQKYLRYYVWGRAFGREGEGQRLDVAQHYEQRFLRGVALLKRFGDSASMDRVFRRESEKMDHSRPPLVHLPSSYERVL